MPFFVLFSLCLFVTCYGAAIHRSNSEPQKIHPPNEKELAERIRNARLIKAEPLVRVARELKNDADHPKPKGITTTETEVFPMNVWIIPKPKWNSAFLQWKSTWPAHVYIFSALFIFAALLVTTIRCYVYYQEGSNKRELFAEVLTTLLFLFSLLRATCLLADAYGHKQRSTYGVSHFIWSLAAPCLTASYAVLLVAMLDSTKTSLLPAAAHGWRSLVGVTGIHFLVVMLGDVVLLSVPGAKIFYVICQFLSTIWGLTISVGYALLALKLYYKFWSMSTLRKVIPESRAWRLFLLICITTLVCSTVSLSQLYFLFSKFGPLSNENPADAWPWLRLQNLLRFGEIVSCFLISTELFVVLFCDAPTNELSNDNNMGSRYSSSSSNINNNNNNNNRCGDSRRGSARFGGSTDRNLYTKH